MTRSSFQIHTWVQHLILWALILCFGFYFSWYSIQRYQTLNAYTADLSLIDQAMWNTLHGRFLEATWGDQQQPRTAEHFEPILLPLSLLFLLWDDVRILLIIQAFALALGALPLYWLGKRVLKPQIKTGLSLLFPLLYLLSPPLQAAAVADFHADPFALVPLLYTFFYAQEKRWGWMWFWAIILMGVKENMPTLLCMLGLFLLWRAYLAEKSLTGLRKNTQTKHALGLMIGGSLWFAIATFGIVAPLAAQYFTSEGPIYLVNRFSTDPEAWLAMLSDPDRGRYILGLLLCSGGLALFAPTYLLLGLPLWVANIFSNFPGQYSGEQHYSAPLVGVIMIAAIYGSQRLINIFESRKLSKETASKDQSKVSRLILVCLFLGSSVLAFWHQSRFGWTPFSRRTEQYISTPHSQVLSTLLPLIPAEVPISASAAVHPHLAHRPVAYVFPTIQEAEYILVDVLDVPGYHPNDIKNKIEELLQSKAWHLLAAQDGFIVLKRQSVEMVPILPDHFYSFARSQSPKPQYPLLINFDVGIQFLGFDLIDDPFHQNSKVRLYWQALDSNLSDQMILWSQFYDDYAQPLNHPLQEPSIAALWYPPSAWQTGETIIAETLPKNLGENFHLGLGILSGPDFPQGLQTWEPLASFQREAWGLSVLEAQESLSPFWPQNTQFEQGLSLTGLRWPDAPRIDDRYWPLALRWQLDQPLTKDYTVFLHLLDEQGEIAAQVDAQPSWLVPQPSTSWPVGPDILNSYRLIPPKKPGTYQVRLGLYTWPDLKRLPLKSGSDSLILGRVSFAE